MSARLRWDEVLQVKMSRRSKFDDECGWKLIDWSTLIWSRWQSDIYDDFIRTSECRIPLDSTHLIPTQFCTQHKTLYSLTIFYDNSRWLSVPLKQIHSIHIITLMEHLCLCVYLQQRRTTEKYFLCVYASWLCCCVETRNGGKKRRETSNTWI